MTADKDFTFEPVPSNPPIVEAVPTPAPDFTASANEDENPSDTAILVGCGLAGWVVGGPFLALLTALGGNWAKKKQGPFGESTRAVGRITAAAGKKAKDEKLLHKMKSSVASLFGGRKSRCEHCDCEGQNVNMH
eukprot:scaffold2847_cov72-Skeletonema_dohrnii-CCMP3373.AAC.1